METFSALLAICAGNSPVPGEFSTQRPVTGSFDVFFDLRPYKRLSKQWWGWWIETQSCPLWRHCNATSEYLSLWYHWRQLWSHWIKQYLVTLTVMQDLLTPGEACKIHQWLAFGHMNIFASIQHCKYNDRKLVPHINLMRRLSCHLLNFLPTKRCENKIWSTLPASRSGSVFDLWMSQYDGRLWICYLFTVSLAKNFVNHRY